MFNVKEWIQHHLPRNGIVVEAGTADGNDTTWFAQHFNEGRVYGFEPYVNYFQMTKEKTAHFSNVEISPFALDATTGTKTFYLSDLDGGNWGSSSLHKPKEHLEVHPAITFKSTAEVKTINLDEWFVSKEKDIPEVTLMWLDIQGSEPDVLMHAPKILSKTKYLYTEVSFIETYENIIQWDEFRVWLEQQGFEIIQRETMWRDMGNMLLRNKNRIN